MTSSMLKTLIFLIIKRNRSEVTPVFFYLQISCTIAKRLLLSVFNSTQLPSSLFSFISFFFFFCISHFISFYLIISHFKYYFSGTSSFFGTSIRSRSAASDGFVNLVRRCYSPVPDLLVESSCDSQRLVGSCSWLLLLLWWRQYSFGWEEVDVLSHHG